MNSNHYYTEKSNEIKSDKVNIASKDIIWLPKSMLDMSSKYKWSRKPLMLNYCKMHGELPRATTLKKKHVEKTIS